MVGVVLPTSKFSVQDNNNEALDFLFLHMSYIKRHYIIRKLAKLYAFYHDSRLLYYNFVNVVEVRV